MMIACAMNKHKYVFYSYNELFVRKSIRRQHLFPTFNNLELRVLGRVFEQKVLAK